MKLFVKVWLVMSVLLLLVVALSLLNTYVSIKYEIDEPKAMGRVSEVLLDKEKNMKSLLQWLWIIGGYTIINVFFISMYMLRKERPNVK